MWQTPVTCMSSTKQMTLPSTLELGHCHPIVGDGLSMGWPCCAVFACCELLQNNQHCIKSGSIIGIEGREVVCQSWHCGTASLPCCLVVSWLRLWAHKLQPGTDTVEMQHCFRMQCQHCVHLQCLHPGFEQSITCEAILSGCRQKSQGLKKGWGQFLICKVVVACNALCNECQLVSVTCSLWFNSSLTWI